MLTKDEKNTSGQLGKSPLKNNTDLYHKMIEEIQDYAIILLDKDGIVQNWNKGAEKIKQYTEEEIVGKHFSIFYLPEDLKNNLPNVLINEAVTKGRAEHEGWRKRKDGTMFWGSITITCLHDDDGSIIGFSKVTRDLTDKKIAEDKLRLSEERYHQMIAEVEDYAIILLNEHGIIENWNTGAEHIKGYTSDEVVGKKFDLFYTPEDRKNGMPDKLLKEARKNAKAIHEGWRVRKDGTRFWGTTVITALHNKQGGVIGFSKVTRDLTQKKRNEEKLISYTAELEIRNSELEQFAYVASHDLQEPLRKIQTFADLIQNNLKDEAFVKKYFQKLDLSAKRMAELVRSLLHYSRLAKEKTEIKQIDLNELLNDIRSDFELLIEERHATINSEVLPGISGNRTQLGQLFSNLISNSLKFSVNNPLITISSCVVQRNQIKNAPDSLTDDKYLRLTFKDNGIGFEQEYDKIIFSLFQRLHKKQEYPGTGIGLALCKKIAENHNGFINVTSELGKGTEFYVYLPV